MNKRLVIVFILFLFVLPLWAQSNRPAAESRYDMRLSWNGDEYTLRFEVIVEKEENGTYRRSVQRFTADTNIKLSLQPGNYRFRVIPYDLLNKAGKSSEWITFKVHPVLTAEFPKKEEPVQEIPAVEETKELKQKEQTEEMTLTTFEKFKKSFDGYAGILWMPVIPAHSPGENQFFSGNPAYVGLGVCFGVVYDKSAFINPGLEFSVSWYAFNSHLTHDYSFQHSLLFELDLLAQKWLFQRSIALTFRLGMGISGLQNSLDKDSIDYKYHNSDSFYINTGISMLFQTDDLLFFKIGLDYVFLLNVSYAGYFRPGLGFGWSI